jgi:hypothetical protein
VSWSAEWCRVPSACGFNDVHMHCAMHSKMLSSRMHFAVGALAALSAARCVNGVGQWAWMSGSKTECLGNATAVSSSLAPACIALMSSKMLQVERTMQARRVAQKHTH